MKFELIESNALSLGDSKSPMIRLTPDDSEIKIYELINQTNVVKSDSDGKYLYKTERDYSVVFPSEDKVYSMSVITLMPFHKKVSEKVKDCSELSKKISKKKKGYTVGLFTSKEYQLEVYMRIAGEYSECN